MAWDRPRSNGLVSCDTHPPDSKIMQMFAWDPAVRSFANLVFLQHHVLLMGGITIWRIVIYSVFQAYFKAIEFRMYQCEVNSSRNESALADAQRQLQAAESRASSSERQLESMRLTLDQSGTDIAALRKELAAKESECSSLLGSCWFSHFLSILPPPVSYPHRPVDSPSARCARYAVARRVFASSPSSSSSG